jgi:MOSC domain-containing protein YiiM
LASFPKRSTLAKNSSVSWREIAVDSEERKATGSGGRFEGQLLAIYLHGPKGEALHAVETANVAPGCGVAGDRYCRQGGAGKPDQEVTLIEMEALEALGRECGLEISPGKARRNLVTRGVPLNHLVGREFAVGPVVLRGIRLCEPCDHLEGLTVKGIKEGLHHRGGLRAQVIRGGALRAGNPVRSL